VAVSWQSHYASSSTVQSHLENSQRGGNSQSWSHYIKITAESEKGILRVWLLFNKKAKKQQTGSPDETEMPRSNMKDEVFNLQQQVNQLSSQNKRLEKEVETLRSDSDEYKAKQTRCRFEVPNPEEPRSNESFVRKRKPLKLTIGDLVPENSKKAKKQQTGSPDETEMPRSNKAYVRKRKPLKLTIKDLVPENDDNDEWRPTEASRGKRRRNQVPHQEQEKEATAGSQSKKPHPQATVV
jgi:cell division protein FtsB